MLLDRRWEADRTLDTTSARTAIESQFPGIATSDLTHLGSGWEFDVYLTSDGWCFRFPRRADLSTMFERESRIHALVAAALGSRVAVPRVELWGEAGPAFPYVFAGHRMVPGIGADNRLAPSSSGLGAELGAVLRSLHEVPVGRAVAAGVSVPEAGPEEWLEQAKSSAHCLTAMSPAVDAALRWLEGIREVPAQYLGPPRLVHNDLGPQHLLVGTDSGQLVGLIDWTDTALGDPVRDFLFLLMWRGWKFVSQVLEAYLPIDPEFVSRLEFQSRARSLYWLHASVEEGSDVQMHMNWVANAFTEINSI